MTFYYYPVANCTASTCQLDVGFSASADGGATWTLVAALSGQGTGLAFDLNNTGIVYAALRQATAAGMYRSIDHGATWTRLAGDQPAPGAGQEQRHREHRDHSDPGLVAQDPR